MATPPDEITTAEACEILGGIDRSTLIRWKDEGKITPTRKLPGQTSTYLWGRSDVEALAAAQPKAATA
jgi:predicted site-specific integrase-resolvase